MAASVVQSHHWRQEARPCAIFEKQALPAYRGDAHYPLMEQPQYEMQFGWVGVIGLMLI